MDDDPLICCNGNTCHNNVELLEYDQEVAWMCQKRRTNQDTQQGEVGRWAPFSIRCLVTYLSTTTKHEPCIPFPTLFSSFFYFLTLSFPFSPFLPWWAPPHDNHSYLLPPHFPHSQEHTYILYTHQSYFIWYITTVTQQVASSSALVHKTTHGIILFAKTAAAANSNKATTASSQSSECPYSATFACQATFQSNFSFVMWRMGWCNSFMSVSQCLVNDACTSQPTLFSCFLTSATIEHQIVFSKSHCQSCIHIESQL